MYRPTRRLQATARLHFCSMADALDAPCLSRIVNCLMRIQKRTLVKISAVTLLLTAGVLWLFRDSLRVQYHLRAERLAGQRMFAPAPSTFGQQVVAFLLRRPSWEAWSK